MNKLLIVSIALLALAGSTVELSAAESKTFTGIAARTGTYKRPLLIVDGKRYELKASDTADATVTEMLAKFSQGDTGAYVVTGTRGRVNGGDGIIIDSIKRSEKPLPSTGTSIPGTKAVHGDAPSAAVQTTPAVNSSVVTVGSDRYLVYDYDDLKARNYSVVIPEGLKTVRGLLVHGCYSGGDSRYDWKDCEYYRQFMHLHGFAYVGSTGSAGSSNSAPPPSPVDTSAKARHRAIFDAFEESVPVIAAASRHPELVNAPYVGVGFSAGGGYSLNLMVFAPEKTIAAVSYCSPYNFKRRVTLPVSDALLSVPSISITGEQEGFNAPLAPDVDPSTGPARIDEVFVPYRPKGAEYAWLERQGLGHAYFENRQDVLGMPLLDAAVRARYPKDGDVTQGPIKLLNIDPATGWIADNTTWKSGLTKIYPAKDFKGDLGHSSWLQNEDLAFIYRAYSTYDKPLTITSPGNCWPTMPSLDPGASVLITVDATKFPNWKQMAFYDGAKKLGEITQGSATRFTATNLTPGYHVFSVLATDGDGAVRTADPKLVIVRQLPAASPAPTGAKPPTTFDRSSMHELAVADSLVPVRPGEPGTRPFWNAHSKCFTFAPAFNFKEVPGAADYRFTVKSKDGGWSRTFSAGKPWACLAPVWQDVPVGQAVVEVEGVKADGQSVGSAGKREFHRNAVFHGPYHDKVFPYEEIPIRLCKAVMRDPYWTQFLKTGGPYDSGMYPGLFEGDGVVLSMAFYAKMAPNAAAVKDALTMARNAARHLLSESFGANDALPYFPPCYAKRLPLPSEEKFYAKAPLTPDHVMMQYPAWTAMAYLDLYDVTKEKDFFDAALRIAQTYVKTQQAKGTWKLKLNARTGEVVSRNDLVPIPMIELFERLWRQYDRQEFRTPMTAAFDWMMNNTIKQFNFEAQFQDVPPMQDYTNLSGNRAGEMAAFLFRQAKERPDLVPVAEEILRMEEDQFILWERPFNADFFTPCGLEQYAYYVPVNYSAVVYLDACAAAFRATGKPLYLAKAITMLNAFTWIMDKSHGILPSLMKPGVESLEGWPNCGGCSKILGQSISALTGEPSRRRAGATHRPPRRP